MGFAFLLLVLPGAAAAQQSGEGGDGTIADFRARVVSALRSGDAEAYAALFTDRAVVMPRDGDPIVGRPDIREWAEGLFAAYEPDPQVESQEVRRFGDGWAVDWGRYRSVYEPRGDAEPMRVDETYLWILRENDAGEWRLARIIWNGNGSTDARE